MKIRIVSGIIGIILLLAVLLLGRIAISLGIFILALVGVYEFYKALQSAGFKPVKILGYVSAVIIPVLGLGLFEGSGIPVLANTGYLVAVLVYIIIIVLFAVMIFSANKYSVADIAVTALGIVYVVFLFAFVVLTRNLQNGQILIWMVFIGAFATDTFAYFTGRFLGKRKILPLISPNKTLEGSIGGILGCMVLSLLYGLFALRYVDGISLYHYAIIGLLSGITSQIGDWAASAIKRFVKVKDYGNLMPGHGGVLDRFDSILIIAPLVYFYLTLVLGIK